MITWGKKIKTQQQPERGGTDNISKGACGKGALVQQFTSIRRVAKQDQRKPCNHRLLRQHLS